MLWKPNRSGATRGLPFLRLFVLLGLFFAWGNLFQTAEAAAAAPQIPSLRWQKPSDWFDVRTDLIPAAAGDGHADDTAALQKALDALHDGSVIYFPPGTYRITKTLRIRNERGARWNGLFLVGSGRDTKFVWEGENEPMFLLDGVSYSRFVGFELDGRGKASVGFQYQAAKGFQTEVTHRHLAFRGFTNSGILEDHSDNGQALAETTFENCLFEDCERGVAFIRFNDYDYTFDGCDFRRCNIAIDCAHGNFYVRNCHFEDNRTADIRDLSEHGSSIRRSTSLGSGSFVLRASSVGPLTIQDCHVDAWKNPEGAILLTRPPLLLFDCVFSNPPKDGRQAGLPPVRVQSNDQRIVQSGNRVEGASGLFRGAKALVSTIPPGERTGVIRSASQSFLQDKAEMRNRLFDARREFGAKGDGATDDTAAIQKTIDAAAESNGSLAYLPSGNYVITKTLLVSGADFAVGGSGWSTRLVWRGPDGGTMMEVKDPRNVTLQDLAVGSGDGGAMQNGIDIHQSGSIAPSRMTYDGVYVFGMYQKQPNRKGLHFSNLSEKDVVLLPHVQGNLRFIDCGAATVLANCSYEGSITVEGKRPERQGLLGFQTRLGTIVTHGLYLRDNQNIVMSDFYLEQVDNALRFEGGPDDPPGRATITGAKLQSFTSTDTNKNNMIEMNGYAGQVCIGPYQFYMEPKRMRIKQQGSRQVDLIILASSWYGAVPDLQLGSRAALTLLGNDSFGAVSESDRRQNAAFFSSNPAQADLKKVALALDDLRRLGEADLRLNHP